MKLAVYRGVPSTNFATLPIIQCSRHVSDYAVSIGAERFLVEFTPQRARRGLIADDLLAILHVHAAEVTRGFKRQI
jgi:hypothetical protein